MARKRSWCPEIKRLWGYVIKDWSVDGMRC